MIVGLIVGIIGAIEMGFLIHERKSTKKYTNTQLQLTKQVLQLEENNLKLNQENLKLTQENQNLKIKSIEQNDLIIQLLKEKEK